MAGEPPKHQPTAEWYAPSPTLMPPNSLNPASGPHRVGHRVLLGAGLGCSTPSRSSSVTRRDSECTTSRACAALSGAEELPDRTPATNARSVPERSWLQVGGWPGATRLGFRGGIPSGTSHVRRGEEILAESREYLENTEPTRHGIPIVSPFKRISLQFSLNVRLPWVLAGGHQGTFGHNWALNRLVLRSSRLLQNFRPLLH